MDLDSLDRTCGGTGYLNCECGGDFCVCKLNGGLDCPGCEDCNRHEEDEDWDYPYQDEEDYALAVAKSPAFLCSCGVELNRADNPQQCACLREHASTSAPIQGTTQTNRI